MGPPTKKPSCEIHGDKLARWPREDPHFCSLHCAARYALETTRAQWCKRHAQWYSADDGCYDCDLENKAEDTQGD